MQLGYFTMPLHPPGASPADTLADDLEQLETLDRLGFGEAWIGEHITSEWENIPCPDLLIAQALVRTSKIRLGTGVSCLPNHDPMMLAQRIAQLDHMARGRLNWGIGSGGFPGDIELTGFKDRVGAQRQVTRDVLDAVLDLWGEARPGAREHARWRYIVPAPNPTLGIRLHMRPFQRPHPPIGVAGLGPRSDMLTLAGERGWIPMSINFAPTPTLKTHWQAVEQGAARAGLRPRRADWRIARDIHVGETTAQARREALAGAQTRVYSEYFFPLTEAAGQKKHFKVDPSEPDDVVTPDYL
ncbi:MAG TPA: LLM class flavin-dependent oxidoreductase, partial [Chloroflexota bacterium]